MIWAWHPEWRAHCDRTRDPAVSFPLSAVVDDEGERQQANRAVGVSAVGLDTDRRGRAGGCAAQRLGGPARRRAAQPVGRLDVAGRVHRLPRVPQERDRPLHLRLRASRGHGWHRHRDRDLGVGGVRRLREHPQANPPQRDARRRLGHRRCGRRHHRQPDRRPLQAPRRHAASTPPPSSPTPSTPGSTRSPPAARWSA